MAAEKALDGKPCAGSPHVRFDVGTGAPRHSGRFALLYKEVLATTFAMFAATTAALADAPPGATVITTREGLAAIADDLAGYYVLDAEIDLGGAFVGHANGVGLVTESYYDTSANGQMEASGTSSPRGSAVYVGIAPLDADDMMDKTNFSAFDFTNTWIITEADGAPALRTFFSAYALWLKDAGIAYEPEPDELVNGIPAGARYVFGIDPVLGPADLAEPLIDITFDANGKPGVKLPAQANTEGATVTVLATEDLTDWSDAKLVPIEYNESDGIWYLSEDSHPPKMFFKWRVTVDHVE